MLDTKTGNWQRRKRLWKTLGIKSEEGRDVKTHTMPTGKYDKNNLAETFYSEEAQKLNTSIFDPALCEVLYHWFCKEGGTILDPFAGGSVRGIVANYLGYKYTGIDIRPEQIKSNQEQGVDILKEDNQPLWLVGDSNLVLDSINQEFDFVFSCPPYADLEVYSDLEGDISNMDYEDFMEAYDSIIKKSCEKLKKGGYACFVVGEVRDKKRKLYKFCP